MPRRFVLVAAVTVIVATSAVAAGAGLRDAGEVRARQADRAAPDYTIGKRAKLDGVVIVVTSAFIVVPATDEPHGSLEVPDSAGWRLGVLVQNLTKKERTIPDAALFCKGDEEGGSWYAESTLKLGSELPSGTIDEGVLYFDYKDGCVNPKARFSRTGLYRGRFPPAVDFRLSVTPGRA